MTTNTKAPPTEHGILNCYKAPRITSRVVVDTVQRMVRPLKVGHAGTLDPLAEGVLLLAVGSASRLIPYLHMFPKTYRARFELGRWSDSADLETDVVLLSDPPIPTLEQVRMAAAQLVGEIQQVPPIYSAVKIGGKRAYDAARKNELLTLTARTVSVYRIEILRYTYPSIELEIDCGTGTYIRSLAVDLAKLLNTRGLMSHLVRTRIGPFSIDQSIRAEELGIEEIFDSLRPMGDAVQMLPKVELSDEEIIEIENGRTVRVGDENFIAANQEIAAFDQSGRLRSIVVQRQGGLGPKRVFQLN